MTEPQSTALTQRKPNEPDRPLALTNSSTVGDIMALGRLLQASGYFKDARDPAKAAVILLAGKELGFTPVYSLMNMDVVDGRLTLRAHAMAGLIKRSGRYDYKVLKADADGAEIEFFRLTYDGTPEGAHNPKRDSVGVARFGPNDAKRAGLNGKQNFQKYPAQMYYARAMSTGARWFCPDVFHGAVYAEGEVGEISDEPPTRSIDATPRVVEATVVDATPTIVDVPTPVEVTKVVEPIKVVEVEAKVVASATASPPAAPAVTADPELLAVLSETLPIALSKRILALPTDESPLTLSDLRETHAHLEEQLGKDGAKAAWLAVNVEVKKGAVVKRGQVVALARSLSQTEVEGDEPEIDDEDDAADASTTNPTN